MVKNLTGEKLVRVVVLVRWEELTQEVTIDIREDGQVEREARRHVNT